jgi:hypothetical protein
VFSHSPVGPVEAAFMLAAMGLVVYSAYFIKTHSPRQIIIEWAVTVVAIVIFALVLKFLQ